MTMDSGKQDQRGDSRRNRVAIGMIALGLAALLVGVVISTLIIGGVFDGDDYQGPGETVYQFGDLEAAFARRDLPAPAPTDVPPSDAPIVRIVIPQYEVDAPVITLGLDSNNAMESPEEPCDVAWYDFTSHPGTGSNAVFSGHVDWFNLGNSGCRCDRPGGCGGAGPAVFWHLKNMAQGDMVEVWLEDGTVYKYQVITKRQVSGTENFAPIVAPTQNEIITLITCGGTFSVENRHYNNRVIVQAERVFEPAAVGASAAP